METTTSSNYISLTNLQKSSIIEKLESCKSLKEIKQIHCYCIKTSATLPLLQLLYTSATLSSSSNRLPDITYIYSLFTKLDNPNIHLYNTIIRSFPLFSFLFYCNLLVKGLVGDRFTYPYVLKACTPMRALRDGQQIHSHVVKNGLVLNLYVVNSLIRFYAQCGVMESARKVFDTSPERDIVTWTTLIQGYVQMGCFEKGLQVFYQMCETGISADEITMVVLLSACAKLRNLSVGKKLHKFMCDYGLNFNDVYVNNALIDMYLKCGDNTLAFKVFNEMMPHVKNIVSWNSMITGLVRQGEFRIALKMFKQMQNEGVKHDNVTLVAVLNCCANLGTLKQGKWVHSHIHKNSIETNDFVGNALIDMYMKCGEVEKGSYVFNIMKCKDVYTYTTMIVGLAINGEGQRAIKAFSEMHKMRIKPNDVTYLGILIACTHSGLVDEGCKHFMDMLMVHNITPQKEHYGCLVDLLGRAGLVNEAEDFITNVIVEPDFFVWGALLAACRTHGNIEIGKRVMEKIDQMDIEKDDGAYILMSNLYSSSYRWKDALNLRKTMKERNMNKSPGCSSIEVDGMVYEFRKGDKSHLKANEIYTLLNIMGKHLKNTPLCATRFVL